MLLRRGVAEALSAAWERVCGLAAIGPDHRRARRFAAFGEGSIVCFPYGAMFGERYVRIGRGVMIGPHVTLSAGLHPDHDLGTSTAVSIGDGSVIGRGSGIVAHECIEIGAGVFTGHNVYVTDANHGYENLDLPIGHQFGLHRPVSIGDGSWIGHGAIVLPGATIGRHVAVGAGSVVTGTLPDYCVAVGNPARVIRRYDAEAGWITPASG
jgi:acetyltransferase-like isoleucine patch superfamily enzyme